MAAHLTAVTVRNDITFEEAMASGYRFCGGRKAADAVMRMHNLQDRFVVDPGKSYSTHVSCVY